MSKQLLILISVVVMSVTACPSVLGQMKGEVAKREFKPLPAQTSGNLLRAEKTAWPDSTVRFTPDGKPGEITFFYYDSNGKLTHKKEGYYNRDNKWVEFYKWEYTYNDILTTEMMYQSGANGEWNVLYVRRNHKDKKVFSYYDDADKNKVYVYTPFRTISWTGNYYKEVYDNQGKLTSIKIGLDDQEPLRVDISYDERNNPVMVDFKDADPDDGVGVVPQREIYEWDDKGNVIYYEEWGYDNTTGGLKLENKTSCEYEYDKYGNETKIVVGDLKTVEILNTPGITPHVQEYLWDNNNWKLDSYTVYYPAGSNLESENNESVGEDNKGGFDIILNVPKDSIAGGSFFIDLPEGFVLDQENTKLTVDFNQFELVITKQPANSWRLEIKAKTKAFLAMQEQSQEGPAVLAHIAYLVDETLKRDKYDIALNNIQFTTLGNLIIPEPEMIVSVQLNRWATSTESIGSQAAKVVCENQVLIIDSPVSESIEIYSVAGFKVYQGIKPAGQVTVNLSHLPGNVIIVKGGNSWVKKIFVR